MIQPLLSHDDFLKDVKGTKPGDGFALWWLGQSGFLVKHRDRHLLLDPYLSDSLTRKYAQTDKPHVRMTDLIVDPGRLDFIDVVTSSHNHTDHLDADTLTPLIQVNADLQLVIPDANRQFVAERLNCDPQWPNGLDDGASVDVAGFEFHAVPAAHEEVERDDQGRCRFLGYVIRFGRWTIYHSGDTVHYEGMAERLRGFDIDVVLLPINGRRTERRVAGNLWGEEAARLAKDIAARMVIPCHFEMFEFNTEPPDQFLTACGRLDQPHRVLRCGESFSSDDLPGEQD